VGRSQKIRLRQNHLKKLAAPFHRLLNFVNQALTLENWQTQVCKAMGEEKSCYLTYQSLEGPRRAKMLDSDIGSNLQVELFGTAVIFDPEQSRREIAGAILEVEDCIPQISGKAATLESAQALREELREILQELAAADRKEPQEQISLKKKIEKAFGGLGLKREAFLFPDGDIFFKTWLWENEDVRLVLFFDLARLVHRLGPEKQSQELVIAPKTTSRTFPLKILNGIMASRIHGRDRARESPEPALKLSLCGCGCQGFFLQSGERGKKFINDHHRMKFHNTERTRTGANREAVRRHRLKNLKAVRNKPKKH